MLTRVFRGDGWQGTEGIDMALRIRAIALLLMSFCLMSAALARITTQVERTCPVCETDFNALVDLSGTQCGVRLDLKPLGNIGAPWLIPVCPDCSFVIYKQNFEEEELEKLRTLVASEEYKKVAADNPSYFLLAKIYEHLGEDSGSIAYAYLQASWQVEWDPPKCDACLEASLRAFSTHLETCETEDETWATSNFLCGEIERRLRRFEQARERFEKLREMPQFQKGAFPGMIALELKLIEQRNWRPHSTKGVEDRSGLRRPTEAVTGEGWESLKKWGLYAIPPLLILLYFAGKRTVRRVRSATKRRAGSAAE